jgi:hypothetical protein
MIPEREGWQGFCIREWCNVALNRPLQIIPFCYILCGMETSHTKTDYQIIFIRIPAEIVRKLDEQAKREHRSTRSNMIRSVLATWAENLPKYKK